MSAERYLRWDHKGPRGRQQSLLWPVEVWTILAPDANRRLNVFQEAILGLLRTGMRDRQQIAKLLGLEESLVAFVLAHELMPAGWVDGQFRPTPAGEDLLSGGIDTQGAPSVQYAYRDSVFGLWLPRVSSDLPDVYPFTVSPIPGDLQSAILAAAGTKVQKAGHGVRFVGLLQPKIEADVEAIAQRSSANEATKRTILTSLRLARLIGLCRVCGHHLPPSSFHGSENGFKAHCGECGSTWMLATANGNARSEYRTGKSERPFAEVGCRELTMSLNVGRQF